MLGLTGVVFYGAAALDASGVTMDLFEDDAPVGNTPEFTVSELSGAVKRTVEGAFSHVRVRGEVGRISRPASGHLYLDLKDDRSVLAGVIWKGAARKLAIQPEQGMEVVATGRLTTFPGSSKYQIVIDSIEPAGLGALMAMLEKRKAALASEGLFDASRKKLLPYLPRVIGVITSPSGAVIQDILHRLQERFPRDVLLWPVPVQGEKCAEAVTAAIRGFNAMQPDGPIPRPDVIIVARGGGSVEDLWGFNEEMVVRAAAESEIPLISAVGHETDTTLIDYAADRRAPTPTAAAEMAVPVRVDLVGAVSGLEQRRRLSLDRLITQRRQRLNDLGRGLPRPESLVSDASQKLDGLGMRLPNSLMALVQSKRLMMMGGRAGRFGVPLLHLYFERRKSAVAAFGPILRPKALLTQLHSRAESMSALEMRLGRSIKTRLGDRQSTVEGYRRMLESLGHNAVLKRGYAVVRDSQGDVVTQAATAKTSDYLEIEFSDGRINVQPNDVDSSTNKNRTEGTLL